LDPVAVAAGVSVDDLRRRVWPQSSSTGKGQDSEETEEENRLVVHLTGCHTLLMEPVEWEVPEFIPKGGITVIAGDGGEGKSAITLDLTGCITRGEPCLG